MLVVVAAAPVVVLADSVGFDAAAAADDGAAVSAEGDDVVTVTAKDDVAAVVNEDDVAAVVNKDDVVAVVAKDDVAVMFVVGMLLLARSLPLVLILNLPHCSSSLVFLPLPRYCRRRSEWPSIGPHRSSIPQRHPPCWHCQSSHY